MHKNVRFKIPAMTENSSYNYQKSSEGDKYKSTHFKAFQVELHTVTTFVTILTPASCTYKTQSIEHAKKTHISRTSIVDKFLNQHRLQQIIS